MTAFVLEVAQTMETAFIPSYEGGSTILEAFKSAFNLGSLGPCAASDDGSGTDSVGQTCDYYTIAPRHCGKFDSSAFKADDLCCMCKYTKHLTTEFNSTTLVSDTVFA